MLPATVNNFSRSPSTESTMHAHVEQIISPSQTPTKNEECSHKHTRMTNDRRWRRIFALSLTCWCKRFGAGDERLKHKNLDNAQKLLSMFVLIVHEHSGEDLFFRGKTPMAMTAVEHSPCAVLSDTSTRCNRIPHSWCHLATSNSEKLNFKHWIWLCRNLQQKQLLFLGNSSTFSFTSIFYSLWWNSAKTSVVRFHNSIFSEFPKSYLRLVWFGEMKLTRGMQRSSSRRFFFSIFSQFFKPSAFGIQQL